MAKYDAGPAHSDPGYAGIPEHADDDSTAYDEVDSVREADGPSPWPIPPDREDGPLALDEYGLTAQEQQQGESLDDRLAREEPDTVAEQPHRLTRAEAELLDQEPVDPHLDSAVSMYDRDEIPADAGVGRLVAPDEGGVLDSEPDAVGYDAGMAGGGASAEEAAMHEVVDERTLSPGEPGDGYVPQPDDISR
jgi:hypothetical protein